MKKNLFLISLSSILLFNACGEETTENITQVNMAMDVVSSAKNLPKCTKDNEGEQAFVKGEKSARVCVDGEWISVAGDYSCTTKELKDKSGIKIICNGDSIGVVKNGAKGDDGADGKGCSVTSLTDSTATIKCGTDSFTMSRRGPNGNGSSDTSSVDTNVVYEIENASISGVSQKGPFVKGAMVTAFELDGSKSLLQTGRTFGGTISQDDGRFNLRNVTLKSCYVRLSANGYYRNEVTGERSVSPITLNAVTDLDARNTVNVNLLTHLEYERVAYLMTHGDGTLKIKKLKKQAEREIFNAFHIDATGFGYSEDLDVFGKTEADAALLAISILLQGDRNEAELTELLTDFSTDFSTDSTWDDLAKRAEIADSALSKDAQGKLATYRSNVEGWGLSTGSVPHFEKYIRRFASIENGLGVCGDEVAVGTVKQVTNPKSKKYYAKNYTDATNNIRFICVDADSAKWRVATNIEKDTMGWAKEFKNAKDGDVHNGKVNTNKTYVYENKKWRTGTNIDSLIGRGCVSSFMNESASVGSSSYTCTSDGWVFDSVNVITDSRDKQVYKTIKIGSQYWMAENLNYKVENSYCYNNSADSCTKYGRLYTWAAAVGKSEDECGYGKTCGLLGVVKGVCPEGWHLPSSSEWNTLYSAMGEHPYAMQAKGFENWSFATDTYGFSVLPAGYYYYGNFYNVGAFAYFWSASENGSSSAYLWGLGAGNGRLNDYYDKGYGFSVRCIVDNFK